MNFDSTRPQNGGIEHILSVGHGNNKYVIEFHDTVDASEKLIDD